MTGKNEKIRNALTRLLLWHKEPAAAAFFSSICLQLEIEEANCETMRTDGQRIQYNKEFVESCTEKEVMGVLVHEALHVGFMHHCRMGNRDMTLWNIACDLAINPICKDLNLDLPQGCLFPGMNHFKDFPLGQPAEVYYGMLVKQGMTPGSPPKQPGGSQQGTGSSPQPGQGSQQVSGSNGKAKDTANQGIPEGVKSLGDVFKPGKGTREELEETEGKSILMVEAAHTVAKAKGNIPGFLERIVKMSKGKICWKTQLQNFLNKTSKHKVTWKKPNKRFFPDLYLPSLGGKKLGPCVVLIDTSGSISQSLLGTFAAEVNSFRKSMNTVVDVLWHDTKVYKQEHLEPCQDWIPQAKGGGGTCHVEAFEKAVELSPRMIVSLTDCYSSYPADPGVQSIFVRYGSGGQAPVWATSVIDMEE